MAKTTEELKAEYMMLLKELERAKLIRKIADTKQQIRDIEDGKTWPTIKW